MNARTTALIAGGIISALLTLSAIRGMPGGGLLFWFSPFPLFAVALGFGAPAAAAAGGVGALVMAVSGGPPATVAWVLLFAMPVSLLATLAMRPMAQGGAQSVATGLSLTLPFTLLALWPAVLLLGAEFALADQPGGLSGALRTAVQDALDRMGTSPEMGTAELVETVVRIKPLAFAIWFAVVMVANASAAQGFMDRRGLALHPVPRWSMAALPRWYGVIAVVPLAASLLAAGAAGFGFEALAMMLAVPLVLQGLAVVHVVSLGRPRRPVILGALYVSMLVFLLPVGLGLAGLGLAEIVLNLRARAPTRGAPPGPLPPED